MTRVFVLMVTDLLTVVGFWLLSLWGYWAVGFGRYKFGWEFYLRLWPVALAFVFINGMFRLYHGRPLCPGAPVSPPEELRRLVGSAVITHFGTLAVLALAFQTTEHYSRAVVILSCVFVAVFAQPMRDLARALMRRWHFGQIPVDVFGESADVARMKAALGADAYFGFAVAETVGEARVALVCGNVSLAGSAVGDRRYGRYAYVEYAPPDAVFPCYATRSACVGGLGVMEVENQRSIAHVRAAKGVLDMSLAVITFLVTLPLFFLLALAVKLTSKGPVFFRHERIGRGGRRFKVWKFRTMYADADRRLKDILAADAALRAEWEEKFKLENDPRITRFGRFLRRTSLDELPQLFNVFAGDMALVGPRPIVAAEVARYGENFDRVFSVRPGVTGLWQATGRSDVDYGRRVALDLQYVLNWSPWMDVWILFRTVSAVCLMRGAK